MLGFLQSWSCLFEGWYPKGWILWSGTKCQRGHIFTCPKLFEDRAWIAGNFWKFGGFGGKLLIVSCIGNQTYPLCPTETCLDTQVFHRTTKLGKQWSSFASVEISIAGSVRLQISHCDLDEDPLPLPVSLIPLCITLLLRKVNYYCVFIRFTQRWY